ncbi:MAG: TRAP transporter substrate-binding protein [Deltaproteobacteria bacterium]|nr:TRAP transporter substrate-binding protein [Deltaproteobacteria bacterium]
MKAFRSVFVITVVAAFAVLSFSTSFAASKPIQLSYANFFPPTHIQAKLGIAWADEIEKRTNGKVKFTHFPGGALLKGPEIYDGVTKGITDVGMSVFAYTKGRFPSIEAIDLPMGYPNGVAATKIINDFYKKFNLKEFDQVKILYLYAHGPGILHSKKPVHNMDDMKGLKIRSTGTSAQVSKALGAVPVAMPQGATYEALQKGVVEATWVPIEALKGWKQGEVIKYTIDSFSIAYTQGFFVAMNKKKWSSLPADVQKVIEEVSEIWIGKTGEAWDQSDKEGREFSTGLGNETISLSDEESDRWATAVQPVMDAYIEAAEKKGLPGKDYVNFIKEQVKKYQGK